HGHDEITQLLREVAERLQIEMECAARKRQRDRRRATGREEAGASIYKALQLYNLRVILSKSGSVPLAINQTSSTSLQITERFSRLSKQPFRTTVLLPNMPEHSTIVC